MWKKIASLAAMVSASLTLNACQTSAGKPVNCLPAFQMKGRCAKVPPIVNRTVYTPAPKAKPKTKQQLIGASVPTKPTRPPRQNVYGVPQ